MLSTDPKLNPNSARASTGGQSSPCRGSLLTSSPKARFDSGPSIAVHYQNRVRNSFKYLVVCGLDRFNEHKL